MRKTAVVEKLQIFNAGRRRTILRCRQELGTARKVDKNCDFLWTIRFA
jgi:hypothetical protein